MGLCGGNAPKLPDPADAYISGVKTDLATLDERRRIEAAAAQGQKVTINGVEYDFTGLGDADYNTQVADRMAAELLQMQRDLGPQYVQQRLLELEKADPQGAAARRTLWETINSELQRGGTEQAAAQKLQTAILGELNAGGALPDAVRQRVSSRVQGGQVARGNWLGNAAAVQEGQALADASQAQRQQRQAAALQFLTTGVSPADAQARRDQQNLANLGSFIAGETPTAQFAQLTGAQNQIVPWAGTGPLSTTNPNAGAQGIQFAQGNYLGQQAQANAQVNPWLAGLSGGLQGLSLYASLGGFQGAPQFPAGGTAGTTPAASPTGGWNSGWSGQWAGQA